MKSPPSMLAGLRRALRGWAFRGGSRPAYWRGCWAVAAMTLTCHAADSTEANLVRLLAIEGDVEVLRAGARTWDFGSAIEGKNVLWPGDQLRTVARSRATIQLADQTIARLGPFTFFRVLETSEREVSALDLIRGKYFFLHRDQPGRVHLRTATVKAAIRGTEFEVEVEEGTGRTVVRLFDGEVALENEEGALTLTGESAAEVAPGGPPKSVPALAAVNVIQWALYYPAILDITELGLPEPPPSGLELSLKAYAACDVGAAARLLNDNDARTAPERVYAASLHLALADIPQAEALLDQVKADPDASVRALSLARALEKLIDAVQFRSNESAPDAVSATAWLAESYYRQSRSDLEAARDAARRAVALSPGFAHGLVRLAELEFAFGRVAEAKRWLDQAPCRPATADVLDGFLWAAENKNSRALESFDRAIAREPGLANAWLGRGLVRIRRGDRVEGRRDLLAASALEPQRAVLRSYLGKALEDAGDEVRAAHELELAKRLDPGDPTAWLYSALLRQRDNRVNEAVRDLERSRALNDHRGVYRSRLLLDQDQAVRGVNLANLYSDAGMVDVGYREAVHAVHDDYANFSTHLFLANSFNAQRDARQVNLRYETPWFSEYLLANLLAPVGAGTLSQTVSGEEYSRLFERNRFGVVSRTEYRSNGDWIQGASQYGHWNDVAYSIDESYRTENGERPNGDFEQLTLAAQAKVRLDERNSLFLQGIYYEAEAGDVVPHYSEDQVIDGLRVEERQEPLLVAGYHHQWAPGHHTLLMGSRLEDHFEVTNPEWQVPRFRLSSSGVVTNAILVPQPLEFESDVEIYTAEVQQIAEWSVHRIVAGSRWQGGEVQSRNVMPGALLIPATMDEVENDFDRIAVYGYYHWQVAEPLRLIAGVSYDRIHFPGNDRRAPVAEAERTEDQWSPKAGLIWQPWDRTVLRAAYARSLGGWSLDRSVQLEPSQVAGFVQSYRSVIPEAEAGSVPAESIDTIGLAWDQSFASGTYLGLSGEWLFSDAERDQGVFFRTDPAVSGGAIVVEPGLSAESLDYEEQTARLHVNQLLGDIWSLGLEYRFSHADLAQAFDEVPAGTPPPGVSWRNHFESTLHQVRLLGLVQLPCGWFAQGDSVFSTQSNQGYRPARPGDEFWQFNVQTGYRFARRRAELAVALLNLTDQDYRLNPLNLTPELPRERTLALRFRFAF